MGKQIKQRVIPRFKPTPYTLNEVSNELKKPSFSGVVRSNKVQLHSTPDLPNNKRGFKYIPCRPSPYLNSTLYATTDMPPYGIHWSYSDRSPEMYVSEDMSIVGANVNDGWRSTRSNICIKEGRWYVEYKIINGINDESVNKTESELETDTDLSRSVTPMAMINGQTSSDKSTPHVRIGLGRREAALEAPVGFDGYSYAIRDINCEKIHLSKRTEFVNGYDLKTGDVIGILIDLPSLKTQREIAKLMILQKTLKDPIDRTNCDGDGNDNLVMDSFLEKGIVRDMIPIKYKNELFFENLEYTKSNMMEHLLNPVTVFGERTVPDTERFQPAKLPGSSITVFINGESKGKAFENLSAFLPPASERREAKKAFGGSRKKADNDMADAFFVDNDDGELGYYPMVSCFRGGSVALNTERELWIVPDQLRAELDSGDIKPYYERTKFKIVEEMVQDVLDNAVNNYLDVKEVEINARMLK